MDTWVIIIIIGIALTIGAVIIIAILSNKKGKYGNREIHNEINRIKKEYEDKIDLLNSQIERYETLRQNQTSSVLTQKEIDEIANQLAQEKFERWKEEYEEEIRA